MRGHSGEAATEDARERTHTNFDLPSRGGDVKPTAVADRAFNTLVVHARATLALLVIPRQKIAEGRSAVTVQRLFFGTQLGECFSDWREVKKGVVAESACAH